MKSIFSTLLFAGTIALASAALVTEKAFTTTKGFTNGANSGTAADGYDANFDGESNLLEFATGQDPYATTLTSTLVTVNGNNIEFRHTGSKAAMADGVTFAVEWSDTLGVGTWSGTGVIEQPPIDNGTVQTVKTTCPAGIGSSRFVQFKLTR